MTAIDQIREVLHLVSGVLMWPVLLGLLLLAALMIVVLGEFARESFDTVFGKRVRRARGLARLEKVAAGANGSGEAMDLRLERALQDEERRLWRPVAQLRPVVRVGPALGLMGTLIPMAYALQGLAEGNLPSLASNLVTAFAATVIGLAVSVIAYLVAGVRESWVRSDIQALAFRADELLGGASARAKG
ncbi:MAG: MotA/TolQ/ExbB proton channel family protein [Proteobacteria bacterium]|nr:MotA/TolQ/ExbB proton channel family protein [Pseudomonadota bacterium]